MLSWVSVNLNSVPGDPIQTNGFAKNNMEEEACFLVDPSARPHQGLQPLEFHQLWPLADTVSVPSPKVISLDTNTSQ